MPKLAFAILAFALLFCACGKGNRWYGSFSGSANVHSTVKRPAGLMPQTAHGVSQEKSDADEPLLEREGAVAFLTFRKCRLRMELSDSTHARVSTGQTCNFTIDGYATRLAMKGTAEFQSAETFYAEITGTPTEAGVEGEYTWKFSGTRKS